MKALALIMALTLFGGSVKGSPIIELVQSTLGFGGCCQSESSLCEEDSEEPDSCCGDIGCECTCCVHIMIFTPMIDFNFIKDLFHESGDSYLPAYHRDHLAAIFHPPILA